MQNKEHIRITRERSISEDDNETTPARASSAKPEKIMNMQILLATTQHM